MSKTLMIQHVVFCTKHRSKTINLEKKKGTVCNDVPSGILKIFNELGNLGIKG